MNRQPGRRPRVSRSVFRTITAPLLILLLLEAAFLMGGIHFTGVIRQLDVNAEKMLAQQVENRKNYLQTEMVSTWSTFEDLSAVLNATAEAMIADGRMDLGALEGGLGGGDEFLAEITPQLVSSLYARRVSGIFVILNTGDLSGRTGGDGWPGICIRDLDPLSPRSSRNADLLLERAPIAVVRSLDLPTDGAWAPLYGFEDTADWPPFYRPFQAAYDAGDGLSAENCKYWSAAPYVLPGTKVPALSCSVPLVLDDGTVYGVLGIELLEGFLRGKLPHDELFDQGAGTYILAVQEGEVCTPVLASGPLGTRLPEILKPEAGAPWARQGFSLDGEKYRAAVCPLNLYNRNTPFSQQKWVLLGAVGEDQLYGFSRDVLFLLVVDIFLMAMMAMLGSVWIGRRLATPIQDLAERVDEAQRSRAGIPELPVTGIREIDRFSAAITTLSRDVTESSTRFLRIIAMASIKLGGFEVRDDKTAVFVTENLFPLFGLEAPGTDLLPMEQFQALFDRLAPFLLPHRSGEDGWLYRINREDGGVRYLMVQVSRAEDGCTVGVAEDVTEATLERMRIEHDRDYDLLTGLYNRRAFYRSVETLFQAPQALGCAAMVMMDLDGLKNINDRYGHDLGDQYIRRAGRCLAAATPESTLCSRISGDEFFLFFHGYPSREDIRRHIAAVMEAIRGSSIPLPTGKSQALRISGGIAWYPEDSQDPTRLMKYADFAMYQVKRGAKNDVGEFDMQRYISENSSTQRRKEFRRLLDQELATYHFQPIVDARTGEVRAYEALMRVDMPTLKNPEQVLAIAREEGRLGDVERLTWFRAAESFQDLLDRGGAEPSALLFVNSIASQCMTDEDTRAFCQRFTALQSRLVVEIVEAEHMDPEATRKKREAPGFSGLFALDDYGSGYNSEKNLLELEPNFIKIDISIIRGIDADRDKRQIVTNVVAYAHQRDMLVVAEGVETLGELSTVIGLGVDLLQGYGLARPGAEPPPVEPAALEVIRRSSREKRRG